MNTIKSVIVAVVFLGVIYGVYQLVYAPGYIEDDSPILGEDGTALVQGVDDPSTETSAEDALADIFDQEFDADSFNNGSTNETTTTDDSEIELDFGSGDGAPELNLDMPDDSGAPSLNFPNDESSSLPELVEPTSKGDTAPIVELPDFATNNSPEGSTNFLPAKTEVGTSNKSEISDIESPALDLGIPEFDSPANEVPNSSVPINGISSQDGAPNDFAPSDFAPNENPDSAPDLILPGAPSGTASEIPNNDQGSASLEFPLPENGPDSGFKLGPNTGTDVATKSPKNTSYPETGMAEFQPSTTLKTDAKPFTPAETERQFTARLEKAWEEARQLIERENLREALAILSTFHDDPRLTVDERSNLLSWLDPLARTVVYSTQNHLEPLPYIVKNGDSIESIAAQYELPAQLLFNINSLNIPNRKGLTPGTKLKVMRGPFSAQISLSRKKLTLFLGDLYAGRFSVRFGIDNPPKLGESKVTQKSDTGRDYQNARGVLPATSPSNPYGKYLLDIGEGVSIHSSAVAATVSDGRGSISLSPVDAQDVFGILSIGSKISIVP